MNNINNILFNTDYLVEWNSCISKYIMYDLFSKTEINMSFIQ